MSREDKKRREEFLKELKDRCGGVDFVKDPPTEQEKYEAIRRSKGCLSLQEIAYERRRIKKYGLKYG